MVDYIKIVLVPFNQPISNGIATEVLSIDSSLVNSGRKAYADLGVNVITQPATTQEYCDYSNGLGIAPNQDNRTVSELAGKRGNGIVNELQDEYFGF